MDFGEVIQTTKESVAPFKLEPGGIYAMVDSSGGVRVVDTDTYAKFPRRQHRCPISHDAASFLAYLGERGVLEAPDGLEVWADKEALRLTAILDGHSGWCHDTACCHLELSQEWKAWMAASGKLVGQIEFAEFIEDQLSTIAEPDGAVLLEIVQSMQGTTKAEWTSAEWLANGQRGLAWVEEVEAKAGRKGRLDIPAAFTLGLRPFLASEAYRVTAALRYRINQGRLLIGFKLIEPHKILESAFTDVVDNVSAAVPVPVLWGHP